MRSGIDVDTVLELVLLLVVGSSNREADHFARMPSTALFADFARLLIEGLCARATSDSDRSYAGEERLRCDR